MPTRSVSTSAASAGPSRLRKSPISGAATTSGRPVVSQWATPLIGDHQFERGAAHEDEIKRAVLLIGGKQPVERQQAREQRRKPEDRRTDALEQREVRPERERHHRRPRQGRTARPSARRRRRARRCACRERACAASAVMAVPLSPRGGGGGGEARCGRRCCRATFRPSTPTLLHTGGGSLTEPNLARGGKSERAMGCGQDDAAGGEMPPHEFGQALLPDGIERAQVGSSSSQIGRVTARRRAIERRRRWPAER